MGAMKAIYQELTESAVVPFVVEYAVVVDGVVHDVYPLRSLARRDARMMVENAVVLRGACDAVVEVVPFVQGVSEVFAGSDSEATGIS